MTSMEDVADRTMTLTEEGASSANRHESDTNFDPAQSVLSKFDSLLTLTYGTEMEEKARDELLRRILDVKRSTFSAFKAQNEYASSLERSVELQKMHVQSSRDKLMRKEKVIGWIKKEIADIGAAKKVLGAKNSRIRSQFKPHGNSGGSFWCFRFRIIRPSFRLRVSGRLARGKLD